MMQEEKTEKEKKRGGVDLHVARRAVPLFELEGLGGRGDGRE